MTNERNGATTYRTSRLQRGLALVAAASLLLLAGLQVTGERPFLVASYVDFALTAVGLLAAIGYGLQAKIRVSEQAIRKTRPLRKDSTVRFGDVQRVHLPSTEEGLWLYTSPDGSPDLAIEALSFERFEKLACQVIRRLPPGAEVNDPVDRLDEYPCGEDTDAE
ncbi:MAG: hypothetical protein BRD30_05220 [Bacteroidetes bacterium QH_2_63_10]|nr:MAG: hypothetical protein BRD30_05220 [Bacteroidetes bacterium QH_2_63_10]